MKHWFKLRLYDAVRFAQPLAARLSRPLTMGVRAMVFDPQGRICLIRHAYAPGWHMPGGAVEPGETLADALARELHEETGLQVSEPPALFGVYLNEAMARRDHVALFVVRKYRATDRTPSRLEIAEQGFFALDALPPDVTGPTRRRIAELMQGDEPDPLW